MRQETIPLVESGEVGFERIDDVLAWWEIEENGRAGVVSADALENPEAVESQWQEIVPAPDDGHLQSPGESRLSLLTTSGPMSRGERALMMVPFGAVWKSVTSCSAARKGQGTGT